MEKVEKNENLTWDGLIPKPGHFFPVSDEINF